MLYLVGMLPDPESMFTVPVEWQTMIYLLQSILDVMNGIRRQAEGHNPAQKAVSAEYERLCEVLTGQGMLRIRLCSLSHQLLTLRRSSITPVFIS